MSTTGIRPNAARRDATSVTLGAIAFAVVALIVWLHSGGSVPRSRLGLVAASMAALGIGEYAVLRLHGRTLAPIASAAGIGLAMTPLVGQGSWLGVAYALTLVAAIQVVASAVRAFRGHEVHATESSVRLLAITVVAVAARAPLVRGESFVGHPVVGELGVRTTALWAMALALLGVVAELGIGAMLRSRSLRTTIGGLVRLDLSEGGGLALATASAAAAIASASPRLDAIAVPLFTVPLVLVQVGMRRFHTVEADRRASILAVARLTDATGHTRRGHAESVAELAVAAGQVLGAPETELAAVRTAALLHDVGQVALDTPIPGGATVLAAPSDQQQIADSTLRIVRAAGDLDDRVTLILEHQTTAFRRVREFGDPVPLGARILKAANAYVDLTAGSASPRVHARAMERLTLGLGYEYDPAVIRALEVVHGDRG